MNTVTPIPTYGLAPYICVKSLCYKGLHFDEDVVYGFSHSWYGNMAIPNTFPIEEIPIELFNKHFVHNHLCKIGQKLPV